MATEKRLIDANALKALFDERYDDAIMQMHTRPNIAHWEGVSIGVNWGRNTIADAPTVDAVEVVRCKDCKYCTVTSDGMVCERVLPTKRMEDYYIYGSTILARVEPEDFCSHGERKEK